MERRFLVKAAEPERYTPNVNVTIGQFAPIITMEQPDLLDFGMFGFTPAWKKDKMAYWINARAEGDGNAANDPQYTGGMGIAQKPAFRGSVKSKRCLIPADAFIEGPEKEKLNKPYLVYLRNKVRPFAVAGIYDDWTSPATGATIRTFAIITLSANPLLQAIGHHRMPVVLDRDLERVWLEPGAPTGEVLIHCVKHYPHQLMNAYPIDPRIKTPKLNDRALINPIGEPIYQEYVEKEIEIPKDIRIMQGAKRHKAISDFKKENGITGEPYDPNSLWELPF